ncbi:hypothetical protein SLA2020_456520 [Shorea laevis]
MHGTLTSNFVGQPVGCPPISTRRSLGKTATRFTIRNSVQTASFNPAVATNRAGSLYEVLRVDRTASLTEIKMSYRNLAKMYHPDAVGSSSDGRDFIEIHNAYSTLSDPTARALYDLSLGARARRIRSRVYPTRTWETDQCW